MTVLAILNSLIFIALALLHIYWVFGGTSFMNAVLPETEGNKKLFIPGKLITIAVAAGLLLFAIISLSASSLINSYINKNYTVYGNAFIGFIFFIRAIGDFKYAGFFKTVKQTVFARNDTNYYSPLCSFITLIAFIITYKLYSDN